MNEPRWTKDELIAYILLFAAHSDFRESNHERNVIISRVDRHTFQKIHDEFSDDNDYQSIQKIISELKAQKYTKEDLDALHSDIRVLFHSDGSFDAVEKGMYTFLKRLFE
ncbi:MAG: hypothetical protein KJO49_08300 [Bacteroidia bacterium]|nr:hypothetical protein [Bacteroidia bacterium]MBT8269651.1 hypothetical protein [Bacteroidia bacterium]NNF81417.1 hypothetical protein [Flavobacteriaceae bacterium]NNK70112.1 hypothetical protein [Flavobacteriaceae bacterium]NNL80728.1 hypothetical protein [Flavobacteriaceae bacterium]